MTKQAIPTRIDPTLEETVRGPFYASIEPVNRPVWLYPYHLGTDERVAREFILEIWRRFYDRPDDHRVSQGLYTIALMSEGKVLDCYDGRDWISQSDDAWLAHRFQ